jgi:hypothetical protein
MKNQFCTFEISLKLKELDFDEQCFGFYYEHIKTGFTVEVRKIQLNQLGKYDTLAPLWQQVFDWFREKHNIIIEVWYDNSQNDGFNWLYEIYVNDKEFDHDGSYHDNFYECREQAILKSIELCQTN